MEQKVTNEQIKAAIVRDLKEPITDDQGVKWVIDPSSIRVVSDAETPGRMRVRWKHEHLKRKKKDRSKSERPE